MDLLRVIGRLIFGPIPNFFFNAKLFKSLIREEEAKALQAPEAQPDIVFVQGPIDGVLGYCNFKEQRITIDVLEIFLKTLGDPTLTDEKALRANFDSELTRVLAHEGGHWRLDKRQGKWALIDKSIMLGLFTVVGFSLLALCFSAWGRYVANYLTPKLLATNIPLGIAASVVAYVLGIWLLVQAGKRFLFVWRGLSLFLTYHLSWHERYARRAEKQAKDDRRWDDVIEVS